ncbi:MAG: glycosyltransferase family 4 protein, partial [Alphaproteobacteria bacterium]|nr:glycosyltransferase family 4 protein [Alphaproteobacteria bacterium]
MRLAIVASHPVQYYAPIYRALARRLDLTVLYGHKATHADQAEAGFGVGFDWDVDLLEGYRHIFLRNVAATPALGRFTGVDTPDVGAHLQNADAVLLMGWNLKCFHQALWAAKRRRLPVIVRGDSQLRSARAHWKRLVKELVYPLFLRSFDAALVVGERNHAYWRHYGYPEARLFWAPHCVDQTWFATHAGAQAGGRLRAQLGIAPETKLVLFAGKLVPFKRPIDLVEAAARLRQRGEVLEVMMAGAGPLMEQIRACAAAHEVPLHLLGFRNQSDMPAVYAAANLLVLPSDGRETWGLVVNEALACGCPVLVS